MLQVTPPVLTYGFPTVADAESMKKNTRHLGIGVRIGGGFVVVLALMVALGAIGLRYVAEANQRLKDIAQTNNVKIELATEMHSALRERAISMQTLPSIVDAFEKDDEIQRFNAEAARYAKARTRLESLPLSPQEREILAKIFKMTREAGSEVQVVVDRSIFIDDPADIFEWTRNVAMPRQSAIAGQVNLLLGLQRSQTAAAVQDAENSFSRVRNLMLGLGAAGLLTGITIAGFVGRRVTRQARQLETQAMYDLLTGFPHPSPLH